ncbi:MAG: Drug resistance transporter, EmrB/QacA subfamily, partial [Modestobacter sp.]|nr:Drug resistance transporter, EmrB/QacA subfamily [Modestobacter sp.]
MSTPAPIRAAAGPAADPAGPVGDLAPVEQQGRMTHRQILSALSGMLLAMFV